jgi:hypothetical protein
LPRYEDPDDAEYSEWTDWIKIKLPDITLSELTGFDMVVGILGQGTSRFVAPINPARDKSARLAGCVNHDGTALAATATMLR